MTEAWKPLLILGGSGMLGEALRRNATSQIVASYASRPFAGGIPYQAGTKDGVESFLDRLPAAPSALLLLLAQSSVDVCFRDPATAYRTNVQGIASVVETASQRGIRTIFVSSDAVFDGSKPLWRDSDTPRPILEYGKQKYEAEKIVLAAGDNLVVRIPKLVAADTHPQCFISGWLSDLSAGRPINCATDQRFNPVGANDAARAILALVERTMRGIVHIASEETHSRWELLDRLLQRVDSGLVARPDIRPCKLDDLALPEPRPRDTSLFPSEVIAELACTIRPPMTVVDDRAAVFNRAQRTAKGLQ